MLERIRTENITFLTNIFSENFSARALKEARDRLAARTSGPYTKLRVLQSWEEEIANDELRSALAFQASGDLGEFESNYLGSWKFKLKFRTLGLGLLRM